MLVTIDIERERAILVHPCSMQHIRSPASPFCVPVHACTCARLEYPDLSLKTSLCKDCVRPGTSLCPLVYSTIQFSQIALKVWSQQNIERNNLLAGQGEEKKIGQTSPTRALTKITPDSSRMQRSKEKHYSFRTVAPSHHMDAG